MRIILFIVTLCLSGCLTRSSHTREGDNILANLSEAIYVHFPEDTRLEYISNEARKHSRKDPSFLGSDGMGDWLAIAGLVLGAFVPGAGLAVQQIRSKNQYREERDQNWELAKDVSTQMPEEAKRTMAAYKTKMKKHA